MLEWKQEQDGMRPEFWSVELDFDNAPNRLEIHQADSFTEKNCQSYGVAFDPEAQFALFRVFDEPIPEWCIHSLHMMVDEAKAAGQKYWETL